MSRSAFIAMVCFCATISAPARAQSVVPDSPGARGYVAGRQAGEKAQTASAGVLGFASGVVGGVSIPVVMFADGSKELFVGTSVLSVATFVGALRFGTQLPLDEERKIQGQPAAFLEQFRAGYADEVRRRRLVPAIIGGVIGGALGGAFVWYAANALAT